MKYAVILDGAFVVKKLSGQLKAFPKAEDVQSYCLKLIAHPALSELNLLRIYFHHAPPASDKVSNPLDKTTTNLADTPVYANNESLLNKLELMDDFAIRLGETVVQGWKLGSAATRGLAKNGGILSANDIVPNISQKGVDLRIGLDIARLSLKEMVDVLVVVTGDSDLIPAFKFARREGVRIYLDHMGHSVRRELKVHADKIL